ncbi:g11927 [Coccomyxa viridis]|uniref:G11927 protein n=1 Tax=Coccomyxa viridis TaxID=1274662 RepID=A0ABP1GA87_9CHLO
MASRARNPSAWAGNHEFLITRVESSGRGGSRGTSMLSRLLQSTRKHWKNYAVGFVTLLALVWFLSKSSYRREQGSRKALFIKSEAASCPVSYPKLSIKEISKGSLPYLYGGKPPGCKNCKSNDLVGKFCQYGMTGHGQCDKGQIYYLVQQFLDREFYEILQFTPCDLWPLLKGRTLYFSGDSQTQDFMKAAQCAMYEFTDLGWWELDATGANPGPRQEGFVWHTDPGCILLPEDTRICFIRCDTADCVQKQVVERLSKASEKRDLLVLNFGLHFSKTYKEELEQLVQQVLQLRREGNFPFLLWKDTAPQHFESTFGEYPQDKPKPPMKCVAVGKQFEPDPGEDKWILKKDHSIEVLYKDFEDIAAGGWRNKLTNEVMSQAGIPVVSTWNDTLPLWEFHRDNGHGLECTHFCHPSAPQLWVYRLYETLAQLRREKQIETF